MTLPKLPWSTLIQAATLASLASCAFALSYHGLLSYAETLRLSPPWLLPVVIDLGALGFSISAYISATQKRDAKLSRSLVWACLGVSVVFQLHQSVIDQSLAISLTSPGMYVMAMGHAVAPILLVLNLEVLLGAMLETHRETVKAVRKRETMIRVNNQRKPLKISEKDLADKLSHTTSKKEAAKALGVSVATVYRAMRRAS